MIVMVMVQAAVHMMARMMSSKTVCSHLFELSVACVVATVPYLQSHREYKHRQCKQI